MPRRVELARERAVVQARRFAQQQPVQAAAAAVGVALAVGTVVWGFVRLYTR